MKIKADFITNSSSSSFLVAWEKKVETYKDVKDYVLFTEKAQVIFSEMKKQTPVLIVEEGHPDFNKLVNHVVKELNNGYFDVGCEIMYNDPPDVVKEKKQKRKKLIKERAEHFLTYNKGCYLYQFEFSDGTRLGSELEHGDTFEYDRHLRISNH